MRSPPRPHVTVTGVACPQFVDFVERGITSGRALLGLAQSYLEPLQRAEVDTLVLGCTHYPMLAGLIGLVMGDGVTLVSSADETAKEVYRVLTEQDLLRTDAAAAGAPVPGHRRPGAVHPAGAAVPRTARSAERDVARTPAGRGGAQGRLDEAHRAGLRGELSGSGLRLLGLSGRGRRLPAAARLRHRVAVGAAALRHADLDRRDPAQPPARRPHARRLQLRGGPPVRPGRARTRALPVYAPAGAQRAARRRVRRGPARRRLHVPRAEPRHARRSDRSRSPSTG